MEINIDVQPVSLAKQSQTFNRVMGKQSERAIYWPPTFDLF